MRFGPWARLPHAIHPHPRNLYQSALTYESVSTSFKDDDTYITLQLRLKINFMLGGTNFKTNILAPESEKDLQDMMIVGAHTRRLIVRKETCCPSIATVVASTNNNALQYPGSFRVQETFKSYTPSGEQDMKLVRCQLAPAIAHLKSTMNDRFQDCDSEGHGRAPKSILFHRDGVEFHEKVFAGEVALIKDAAAQLYPGFMKVTYVVVNKNAQVTDVNLSVTSLSTASGSTAAGTRQWDFGITTDDVERLRYYAITNEIGFTKDQLVEPVRRSSTQLHETMQLANTAHTQNLNGSSQLTARVDQTARALPLVWLAS
jgi:hypothetical protein